MLKMYCMKETVHRLRRLSQCQRSIRKEKDRERKKERKGGRKGEWRNVKREKDSYRTC